MSGACPTAVGYGSQPHALRQSADAGLLAGTQQWEVSGDAGGCECSITVVVGSVCMYVVEEWELVRAALALFDRCVIWIAVLATFTLGAPPLREGRSCHAARSWLRERGAACPVGPGPVIGARAARNVLRNRKRDRPSHETLDTDTDTASRPAFAEMVRFSRRVVASPARRGPHLSPRQSS